MHSTPPARRGWRRRWSLLAFLSLLLALPIGLVAQTPALATVSVNAFAGTGTAGFSGDGGAATNAKLNQPQGVAADNVGNVYIFDNLNKRIRYVDSSGNIHTGQGDGTSCSSTTPITLTNSLGPDNTQVCSNSYPEGFGSSPDGQLFFSNGGWLDETGAHAAGKISGTYSPGDTSGSNDAFSVSVAPGALAIQNDNAVYFAESSTTGWPGNSIKELQLIDPSTSPPHSTVTTIAGMSGTSTCNYYPAFSNDGQSALGVCIHPQYLAFWGHYVYFFDSSPGYQGPTLWRVDLTTGKMYHIAGNGSSSNSGSDGSLAVNDGFSNIGPIAVDSSGNVYFGSAGGGLVREVDTSGKLWHITDLGTAQSAYAFDGANNLYIAEPSNNEVVRVSGLGSVTHQGNLVSLGDSVAAGEGIKYGFLWNGSGWVQTGPSSPSWTDTTTALGANFQQCHQSDYAYSRYFYTKYTVYNMACTGASVLQESGLNGTTTSGGLLDQESFVAGDVGAQLGSSTTPRCSGCDAANPLFDTNLGTSGVVLLTVGADDIDFGDWIPKCYTTGCGNSTDTSTLNTQLSQAETDLRTALTELNNRAGSDGYSSGSKLRVVVTDYYNPYGTYDAGCIDTGNNPGSLAPGITSTIQDWIVSGLTLLDQNIKSEVDYAKTNDSNLNISLVDLAGLFTGGQDIMAGHKFCSADPWVYGPSIDYPHWGNPVLPNYPAPMHPTPAGQLAIYQAIEQQAGL